MSPKKGMIVLMGSGELTATMVEVHKEIISRLGGSPKAFFLDTPAGFQLNCDQLSQRAVEYFRSRVQHPMSVVSFKAKDVPPYEAEQAFRSLREADLVLVGPGSPTYAVRNWLDTPLPSILKRRVEEGACLIAASAAALTVGRFTMPVYEIYKVGEDLRWVEGMNILGHFDLNHLVIPHWNNAEGGTHDTRFCFVGEERFRKLTTLLPEKVGILGLDEHTACIMDLERQEGVIRGIGTMTLRTAQSESVFRRGEHFPLEVLRDGKDSGVWPSGESAAQPSQTASPHEEGAFWERVHRIEDAFHAGLEANPQDATNAILELDRVIWQAQQDLENAEFISQAREILREFIVLLGTQLSSSPKNAEACLAPLVRELLTLRESFRSANQWKEADAVRDCLKRVHVLVEDTPEGAHWRLLS